MAKHSRWLADTNDLKRRRKRQAAARQTCLRSAESLEARLALSVSAMANAGLATNRAAGLASNWTVILGNDADNIYVQRVATGEVGAPHQQDLLYANNSSFLDNGPGTFGQIGNIDQLDTIYITNGTQVTVTGVQHDQYPLTSVPAGVMAAGPWTTTFVLSRQAIEDTEACTGQVSYAGNVWGFTNGVVATSNPAADLYPSNVFTFTGPGYPVPGATVPPALPIRPIGIAFADSNSPTGDATVIVTWSAAPVEVPGVVAGPRLDFINYDADNAQRGPVLFAPGIGLYYAAYNQDFQTDTFRLPSSGPIATFTVPVTNAYPGGIVNGTLSGRIDVTGDGAPDFLIAPAQLFGPQQNRLVFTNLTTGAGPALSGTFRTADADSNVRTVTGNYDPLTGVITLQFFDNGNPQALNGDVTIVQATYANYEQDPLASSATFFAGLDIHNEVYVDLLTSGSTINVESPIIQTAADTLLTTGADIDLRATNVNVEATMSALDSIRIGPSNVAFPQIAQAQAYAVIDTNQFLADGVTPNPAWSTVTSIVIPPGSGGLGYNPVAMPVTVWIAPPPAGGAPPPGYPAPVPATATAVVQSGVVTSITIVNPGSGYTAAPQVAISPPPALPPVPGTFVAPGAAIPGVASAAWGAFAVVGSDPTRTDFGQVVAVVLPAGGGGQGYVTPPTVRIAAPPPGGTPATATAILGAGGAVTGFTVVTPGSGYSTAPAAGPQVWVDPPPALAANVVPASPGTAQGFASLAGGTVVAIAVPPGLGGQGYDPLNLPLVFIAAPTGAGGVQATATAIVQDGVVIGFNMTNVGAGYTTIPAVTIQDPPFMPPIGPGFIDPTTNAYPVPSATGQAPMAEQVSIDAAVAAQFYNIILGNDPNTPAIPRGRLFVSTSGSLSGAVPASPGAVTTAARRVFVQADNADILVEGQIFAGEQTYLMQSRQVADPNPTDGLEPAQEPYEFSTRSPATGYQTGLLRGTTIAVTLGNDTPTPEVGAAALNNVDLQTQADSIRVKAATRAGAPLTGPFPYDLTINEVDNVSIDAVAASSRPITLTAGGDMRFNAALSTGSDVRIAASGAFTVTSPLSTRRGQIDVTGASVSVNNSLRVLDPVYDPSRNDITLRATGGDLALNGLVSAVNSVNLIQANASGPVQYRASIPAGVPIPDNGSVEQTIVVTDDYVFSDVNVSVDLTHTWLSDLTIALVAPDGTTITLFDRRGGSGDNLTGTVFDSEATATLASGQAPFTGSFRPAQSLATLYGGRTAGTWRLRVTDSGTGDVGTLTNFGLRFVVPGQQYGNVGGAARVVADRLNVESQGAVSLATNVNSLAGIAATGFKVDEQDDVTVTSLRSGGLVSLRAAGVDGGLENRYSDNAIALTANLIDVTNLEASAPAGSIDIVSNTSKTLVLGRATAIAAGLADPMQAAGTVKIRSAAGDIDVLDAPLAATPALAVRVATTANLVATYAQNVPGTRASTLTATTNVSLNDVGIDGVTNLWVGDRVLVRSQTNSIQNGIYVVTSLGKAGTAATGSPWILTRAGDADTTAELPANTRVTVRDGVALAGKVYSLAYTNTLGTTPITTTVVPNRPGAILVRAATTGSLFATYANGAGTITAMANGVLPLIDGIALKVGDRVLVRQGTHTVIDPVTSLPVNVTRVSNGVYRVVSVGSGTTTWQFQRIQMDGSDVTTGAGTDPNILLGYVNVTEGVLSTPTVGGVYRVGFDSLGISALGVTEVVTSSGDTEIGSDRLTSVVKFIVSSNAGTNASAGALGKMMALRQSNSADRLIPGIGTSTQAMDFRFSTLVTAPIALTQQLPTVTKAFSIDGGTRYSPTGTNTAGNSTIIVDGSRIARDRFGRTIFQGTLSVTRSSANTITVPMSYSRFGEIRVGMVVTGTSILPGTRVTAINSGTRLLTLSPGSVVGTGTASVTIAPEISGLEFGAGSGAVPVDVDGNPATPAVLQSGAVLAKVYVGGFANGAAVTIDGSSGVLVRNSFIGQDAAAGRLSNRYGVLVKGAASSVTLLNNTVVGSTGAGIRVQDTAGRVVMVGNTIGTSLLPNQIGVEITSTAMNGNGNRIGVDPIMPDRALGAVTVTRNAAANTITLPVNFTAWGDLFENLGVKGVGIAVGARIASINQATRTITLTPGGVTSAGSSSITFGNFVNTTLSASTLVLPLGVNMADLFLGQIVSGAGIRGATTITAIDVATRTITLSSPLTATATGASVTFSAPGRNQIAYNRYGVVLAAGGSTVGGVVTYGTTVTNSDIFNNTFDGVRVTGGYHRIGTSTTASSKSNAIYSNGGWGVNITPAIAADQAVRGNYLGTRAPGTSRLPNTLGNINPALAKWALLGTTNKDGEGNVYGPVAGSGLGSGTTRPPSVPFPL